MNEITGNPSSYDVQESHNFFSSESLWSTIWLGIATIIFLSTALYYYDSMSAIELFIFTCFAISILYLGLAWSAIRIPLLIITVCSLFALYLYANDLEKAQSLFLLKYILSSQSAIMWMNVFYVLATVIYGAYFFKPTNFMGKVANRLTWSALIFGFVGLLVRWHESYLIDPQIGHIPVSNLYEVFILFCLITSLIYLNYERKINSYKLGFFSLLIISLAVGFILWYTFDRQAYHIQPLVPALDSYWMKIHVPANFIGYGAFAIAAMTSIAWLISDKIQSINPQSEWLDKLPKISVMDDLTYKTITLGFGAFSIATILGALWAAEAWGGYWSWDPKETWALIVWLNYAAWLHFRISKGWYGKIMAWWSIAGLFITLFAFLGVNMFLSGLHSYGTL